MRSPSLVVVGGSAGSFPPLRALVGSLPADLPASLAITVHIGQHARSRLPSLLSRAGRLQARHGRTGLPLCRGQVYVAPPGCHLLVPDGIIELSNGPRMNRSRLAVDAMFASAARWFGDQVIAVVLSGMLDDGAVGAALVAKAGGTVIVQDPDEAEQASMPRAALAAARGAITRPSSELGSVVQEMLGPGGLISSPGPGRPPATKVTMEATSDLKYLAARETALTRLACPDCGGALAEVECRRSPIIAAMSGTSSAPRLSLPLRLTQLRPSSGRQ